MNEPENNPQEDSEEPCNNRDATQELERCKQERDGYFAGWQRAQADLANTRKEEEKREQEFMRFAEERLLRELLELASPFEHALKNAEGAAGDRWREGVLHTYQQLTTLLKRHGVETIPAGPGMLLNVAYHEAIETTPVSTEAEDNIIVEELEKGYTLQGKVIKASKVKVGAYNIQD